MDEGIDKLIEEIIGLSYKLARDHECGLCVRNNACNKICKNSFELRVELENSIRAAYEKYKREM